MSTQYRRPTRSDLEAWVDLCENRSASGRVLGMRFAAQYDLRQREQIHATADMFDRMARFFTDLLSDPDYLTSWK